MEWNYKTCKLYTVNVKINSSLWITQEETFFGENYRLCLLLQRQRNKKDKIKNYIYYS